MVFEKLETITEIEVEYTTCSCLAIHAGKSSAYSIVDQPIIKIGGVPVIPGSSLKGALRSIVESVFSESGVAVCIPEASIPKQIKTGEKSQIGDNQNKRVYHERPLFISQDFRRS